MAGLCGCCGALKPRYKQLVDNLFPADPKEGLVKNNLEKLLFFAMKSPEKLDRIGEYLAQRLSRDISHGRTGFAIIAMEALDRLLITCHSQMLNLFVESFLKMVHKLLETSDPELVILATASFIKFSNIEEDIPNYHRSYDFFVEKFSAMCHDNNTNVDVRDKVCIAGIQGLQGIIRKTANDDLQINIWDARFMDKIIPSLLYNMQKASTFAPLEPESPSSDNHPSAVAEGVFRDLICRVSFGNINSVISPVLVHLDMHKLWVPNVFAIYCFKIIIFSVQAQYGYIVVQKLLNHLDECSQCDTIIKANIVSVLTETVVISAGGSIGPSVLDVFNTLLRHLRISVESDTVGFEVDSVEKTFQEAIIMTIGEFANNLPDYQKIEILMFVMSKMPALQLLDDQSNDRSVTQIVLQKMLLKTVLKVATKYKTDTMSKAFPIAFLEPLMRMSLDEDPGLRYMIQQILHTLLDRHDNLAKLSKVIIPNDFNEMELNTDKALRQDVLFMKKHGQIFYWYLMQNIKLPNNRVDNYETLYCTLCLISLEIAADEVLLELVRFALSLQQICLVSSHLPITHKCSVQALNAALFNLLAHLLSVPDLTAHVNEVIELRKKECGWYLPEVAYNRMNTTASYPKTDTMKPEWLFSSEKIVTALHNSGHEAVNLDTISVHAPTSADAVDLNRSTSDLNSINIDIPSGASTPKNKQNSKAEITFETLKKVLEDDLYDGADYEKRKRIADSFRNGPFEDIVARSEEHSVQMNNKLNKIFSMISANSEEALDSHETDQITNNVLDMKYPTLFVY